MSATAPYENRTNKQRRGKKRKPTYLHLDTLIRRRMFWLGNPGPGEPMATRERAGGPDDMVRPPGIAADSNIKT
jgi:hypothetical protein